MKFQRATVLLALLVTIGFSLPAGAAGYPTWQSARNATLPSGATGLYNGNLSTLSCPTTGYCAAAGIDQDSSGNAHGLLLNEVNGVWRAPTSLNPPANAVLSDGVTLFDVSCGAPEDCVAVGSYSDAASNQLSFVDVETGGVWARATQVTLPANSSSSTQVSDLHSVVCASAANCSAVGTYSATASRNPIQEGFVINDVHGHWSSGIEVRLPAGANYNPFTTLSQVSCASAGNCSVAGSYIDANNITHALVVNEVAGTWHAGESVATPDNASSYAGAQLSEVSCSSSGNCSAIGTYNTLSGDVESMIATEINGAWSHASEVQLPSTAATNPRVVLYGFRGIACPSNGNCTSGGQYVDRSGDVQGFLVNEISGKWQVATELTLPAGATQAGKNGGVVSVTCSSAGDCSAGAAYENSSGQYEALVASEINHSWNSETTLSLPSNATTVGTAGGVYAVECQPTGSCTAVGSYETSSDNYLGFTDETS